MNTLTYLFAVLVFFTKHAFAEQKNIPDYVTLCKRSDPNVNECYKNTYNLVWSRLKDGIPEMNLPAIEPLQFKKIALNYSNGAALTFNIELQNVLFYGASNSHLDIAHIDFDKLKWFLNMTIPKLRMDTKYLAAGKVMLLEFNSDGTMEANITDIKLQAVWHARKVMKGNNEHLEFYDREIRFQCKHMDLYFTNIFPNKEINEQINIVFNENSDALLKEFEPVFADVFGNAIMQHVNNVYQLFPMKVLYPEE